LDKALTVTYYSWVPITDSDPTNCGRPQPYEASKNWDGKKVVIVSVPGEKDLPGAIAEDKLIR
jgi:alkyl hydroperoxide reductase 1